MVENCVIQDQIIIIYSISAAITILPLRFGTGTRSGSEYDISIP